MTVRSVVRNEDQKCCYRSTTSSGVRVLWEITSACNLTCDFCLVEKKRGTIPVAQAIGMARDLIDSGVDKFMISGGEPLLYKGIEELLGFLVESKVLVKLLTNGTIHNPRIFDLIRRTPTLEVSLSIQSVDEAVADEVFGRKRSFAKLVEAVDELPRERLNIIAVYNTLTADHIEEVIDWVADRGIPCLSIINVFKDPSSKARFRDDCLIYRVHPDHVSRLFDLIEKKREQHRGRMVIRTTQFVGDPEESCGAGRSVLYIDSTGCLLPCTLTENQPYREAVRGMSVKEILRYYQDTLPAMPPSSCVPLLTLGVPSREPAPQATSCTG